MTLLLNFNDFSKMRIYKFIFLSIFVFMNFLLLSQANRETDFGFYTEFDFEQKLYRNLSLNISDELRLKTNIIAFDRNVATVGLDYSFFDKKLKFGLNYANIHLYNNDHYFENRNRFFANISYKYSINRVTISWRLRLQTTIRNEYRGDYKINPRYVMKNKFEIEYDIFGKAFKPFVSCDFSNNLNDYRSGYGIIRLRFQAGSSWRIDRNNYLLFFLNYDEYFKNYEPRIIAFCITYKLKR